WESLCDGCARCCLVTIVDDDTEAVFETAVTCRLLERSSRRCTDYANRAKRVPDCVQLTPQNAGALPWMPETCAYRRLARGQDLPDWHPLISGDPNGAARAGVAVSRAVVSEDDVDDNALEDYITKRRR
ncbi:MAG: YcgN family cysteine cluster protein, partial [Pseudomonadota bacterium]